MKIAILDAETLGADLSLAPLAACGELTVYPVTAPEELADRIRDCEVIVQNKTKITAAAMEGAKSLRLICELATGFDNIDLAAARRLGIAVCNVPGYSTASVVQVTLATVLSLATHLPSYAAEVASGRYSAGAVANRLTPVFHELAGRTWGVVGHGNIGRGVAEVARAMGCRVLYTRATPDGSPDCVSLAQLCRESDVITLHTPLNDKTRALIDEAAISLMKPTVILVNEARGAVTDEAAVARALLEGRIGAFGCDVYSAEPFKKDHPFHALLGNERVLLTPHMAWGSYEARARCLATVVDNLRVFYGGGRQNRVD